MFASKVVRCAWLVNPGEEPRPSARLTIRNGSIVEVCEVPADERHLVTPIALLPRFVNAHTHLEFSRLDAPLPPPTPFTEWIRSVVQYRQRSADAQLTAAVAEGWQESLFTGCRLIGEITTSDAAATSLIKQAGSGEAAAICFRELLGFTADRIDSQLELAQQHIAAQPSTGHIVHGLSPHAPYSVHPDLFHAIVDLAAERSSPVAMHLAETRAEIQLLSDQRGPFVEFLSSLNLWDSSVLSKGTQVLDYLHPLAQLPHALAIHCNYLARTEIDFLGRHPHVAVVYCPRTHAWFGHEKHPWQQLQAAGATVILGTDSRASNPDLSIWKELQFVARKSRRRIWDLLPMITTTAATALGQIADDFTLTVGHPFRAVAMPVQANSASQLHDSLVSSAAVPQSDTR